MANTKKSIESLAKNALSGVSDPKYNKLHLFLDGLKNHIEEANRAIVTCKKPPKKIGEIHA